MRPTYYVYRYIEATRWITLAAFFPMVITLAVFVGTAVTDGAALDEWQTPLMGIGLLSFSAFAIGWSFEKLLEWWERRAINHVYDEAWAVWPQYTDEAKWRKFIESDYQKEMGQVSFSIIPIVIVGVVVGIIAAVFTIQEDAVEIIFALGGFMLIVAGIVCGEYLFNKRDIQARYKRRQQMPPPKTLVSRHGHYDEDLGFSTLRGVRKVEYKAPKKTTRAQINFTVHRRWWEGASDQYYTPRVWTVRVRVPKGYEEEAQALVERFRAEVLKR
jgi:flagellar biosynthesis protein FliQ